MKTKTPAKKATSKKEKAIVDMKNDAVEIIESSAAEEVLEHIAEDAAAEVVAVKEKKVSKNGKPLGRKVNPNSQAQIIKRELEEKRAAGLIKRGRPAVEGSANQLAKAAKMARMSDPNYKGKRGRTPDPNSKRQQHLAEQQARLEAGVFEGRIFTGKPGRPKAIVAEETK